MYPIKPTIKRDRGRWVCFDAGWKSYGRTPREAYERWAGNPTFSEEDAYMPGADGYTSAQEKAA